MLTNSQKVIKKKKQQRWNDCTKRPKVNPNTEQVHITNELFCIMATYSVP